MAKHELEIDGLLIEIHRKPIKNMHLRVYPPDGQVKISAPLRFPMDIIRNFLETKLPWIHSQRKRLTINATVFKSGEIVSFLGNSHILAVEENKKRFSISLEGSFLRFEQKRNASFQEQQQFLQAWYRAQMKILLPPLIEKWEEILNVRVNNWGIKIMKTRWGSCNIRARRIWLNLNLITKPLSCLEYVLVHEMIHLLEANHNKRFYALMDKFLPDWRMKQIVLETK